MQTATHGGVFRIIITVLAVSSSVSPSDASEINQFTPRPGRVSYYQFQSRTDLDMQSTVGDRTAKQRWSLKTEWVGRFRDLEPEPGGNARIEFTIQELSRSIASDGRTIAFDSREPDRADPAIRSAMTEFIGQPMILIVNRRGSVLEIRGRDEIIHAAEAQAPPLWRESIAGLIDAPGMQHRLGAFLFADAPTDLSGDAEWNAHYVDPIDDVISVRGELRCRLADLSVGGNPRLAEIKIVGELKSSQAVSAESASPTTTRFLGGQLDGLVFWDVDAGQLQRAEWSETSTTETSRGEGSVHIPTHITQNTYWRIDRIERPDSEAPEPAGEEADADQATAG